MIFSQVEVKNFKSFENETFNLSNINILLGPNNSGKSALINAISFIQKNYNISRDSVRFGFSNSEIIFKCDDWESLPAILKSYFNPRESENGYLISLIYSRGGVAIYNKRNPSTISIDPIDNNRKTGFIIKYLSNRKVNSYNQSVNKASFEVMSDDFSALPALLAEVSNASHPAYQYYTKNVRQILGKDVTVVLSESGQEPGIRLDNGYEIPVKEMGAGVANIAGLIAELSLAKNKLFLIEEIENDLHPKALKSLLEMIIEKSSQNQFIISTHSNIVLTYLSSAPDTKIYSFSINNGEAVPVTVVEDITKNDIRMREVLTDIGHHFSDFGLYRGWIVFEESSMETIVKKYLIKWFAPSLKGKIGTISAAGADNIKGIYRDMHRLYLFSHLQPLYAEAAWVILDGDTKGRTVRDQLMLSYGNDKSERFLCLSRDNAEKYYPDIFEERVNAVLAQSGDKKRHEKRQLLEDLIGWIEGDEDNAKLKMRDSFDEVIKILNNIEKNYREIKKYPH